MKVYHVRAARRCGVVFAIDEEDAIFQARKQEIINVGEAAEAIEAPLPKGYKLIYDPLVGAMTQPTLPLELEAAPPEPPHTITPSGSKIYDEWRHNVIVDADAPPVVWRAERDSFGGNTSVPGRSRLASENSKDALAWNLFRSLEKTGRLDLVAAALGVEDQFEALYWHRPWDQADPLPEIIAAQERVEPARGYPSEVDIMLKGRRYLILFEPNLGKPGAQLRPWERTGSLTVPTIYKQTLPSLLAQMDDWQTTMRRFYYLLRRLILAQELCRPEVWGLEPHLVPLVNALSRSARQDSHAQEFAAFQARLKFPARQTHLLTWQTLLDRAEASFEPDFRSLLEHVKRLSYLHPTRN